MPVADTIGISRTPAVPPSARFLPLHGQSKDSGLHRLNDSRNQTLFSLDKKTGIPIDREPRVFSLKNGAGVESADSKKAALRKAAEGFEAIFIRQLLKSMQSDISGEGMFGGGTAGGIYTDMVNNALAESMAGKSGLGIADALMNDLTKRLGAEKIPAPAVGAAAAGMGNSRVKPASVDAQQTP
jgi:peptidoglycan hydrolase FlgJ